LVSNAKAREPFAGTNSICLSKSAENGNRRQLGKFCYEEVLSERSKKQMTGDIRQFGNK